MTVPSVKLPKMSKTVKLGRIPPRKRSKAPHLEHYISEEAIAALPAQCDYTSKAKASLGRMYLNDRYGDCVIAGEAHLVGVRSANDEGEILFKDPDILNTYRNFCGPNDEGCNIEDVLQKLMSTGFPGGHKLGGYVQLDLQNKDLVKAAIHYFGGGTLGMSLPGNWANSAEPGFVWDIPASRPVGGHEIVMVGYTEQGVIVSTWGILGLVTWRALADQSIFDEGFASLGLDWTGGDKEAPVGLDLDALVQDLNLIGGGDLPPEPKPPTPPAPPPPNAVASLVVSTPISPGSYPVGGGGVRPGDVVLPAELVEILKDLLGLSNEKFAELVQMLSRTLQGLRDAIKRGAIPWAQLLQMLLQLIAQFLSAHARGPDRPPDRA